MRKYLIGAVVGAALTLSVGVAADTISLTGKSVQGEMQVFLDGEIFDTAAIIDGRSLAPLRNAYEAAGFKVTSEGKKIYLESPVKEVESVSDDPVFIPAPPIVEGPVVTELERVEIKIGRLLGELHGERVKADPTNNIPEDMRISAEARIIEIEAELAELKRQKAELEQ